MLVITTAHHREALPIIQKYELKQNRNFSARPVFESSSIRLVVSGIGNLNAAIATTLAYSDLNPLHTHELLISGSVAEIKHYPLDSYFK